MKKEDLHHPILRPYKKQKKNNIFHFFGTNILFLFFLILTELQRKKYDWNIPMWNPQNQKRLKQFISMRITTVLYFFS
jgi:hypothetical protein